jgi:trimeric autotransporter adhesin
MSTKTTFKRIALVAVAALGLGVLAAVPSSAAPSAANTAMYDTTNGVAIVGAQATVTFTIDTSTTNTFSWSGVGSVLTATDDGTNADFAAYSGTQGSNVINNPTSGTLVAVVGAGGAGTVAFLLTSAVAGTQTITVNHVGASGIPGTPLSKTITWAAGAYTANAGYSTSFIGSTFTAATTADAVIYAARTVGTQAAQISVTLKSDVNADLNGQAITFAITSGPGMLSAVTDGTLYVASTTASGRSVSDLSLTGNTASVAVLPDGTAGTTTITVTAGTTLIATETIYFVGSTASYTPLVAKNTLRVGSNVGGTYSVGADDYVVRVQVKDSNGNRVVNGTTVHAVSSNPLVAAIASSATTTSGYAYFDVTGVIAGEGVTFTFRNASTAAAATVTATSTAVNVTSSTISSLSMKFDKATYIPGEKMTLSITALNAAGKPVADYGTTATGDGVYTGVFSAATTGNAAITGTLPGTSLATTDGVAEYVMYAPLIPGDVTVTTGLIGVTVAQFGTRLTASATIEGGPTAAAAQAAADAANEAIDAANAATDAANAAAEAADAATAAAQDAADAVAALATSVEAMVNALKRQITSLTNLVIKIQKKVRA